MISSQQVAQMQKQLRAQQFYAYQQYWGERLRPLKDLGFALTKRTLDIVVSLSLLVLAAPALLWVAFAIKSHDGGPVFFSQTRVGKRGRRFKLWKFRTMCVHAEARRQSVIAATNQTDNVRFKSAADPRITPVGRILRRWSVDELPQLWNVCKGDMSLVGPRPPIPEEVMRYSADDYKRLRVKPGLTCLWQVSGRSELPFEIQVQLDKTYIANRSLSQDLHLLWRTVGAVISGHGAC